MTQKRRLARQIISLTADFLLEIEAMKRDRYRTPENVSYLAHAEAHLCDLKIIAEAMMVVEYGSHLLTWLYTLRVGGAVDGPFTRFHLVGFANTN